MDILRVPEYFLPDAWFTMFLSQSCSMLVQYFFFFCFSSIHNAKYVPCHIFGLFGKQSLDHMSEALFKSVLPNKQVFWCLSQLVL